VDRPSQKPAAQPEGVESPLSFPVEAPKPSGLEPGAGAPAEDTARRVDPLTFPADPAPLAAPPLFPAETTPPPAEPLPFPVAELPGVSAVPAASRPVAEPEAAPAAEPVSSWLARFGPPVLAAFAALLAVGGCFLPLFHLVQQLDVRQGFDHVQLVITVTAWGNRVEIAGQNSTDRPGVPVGITVVIAIVVLAVAAFAAFSRPDRGLTRWLLSAGAVFTAGVVTTVGVQRLELDALAGEEPAVDVTTGAGMWLLILAIVLAAGAAAVAYLPLRTFRTPGWADPALAYADTPTPPSGVAITVLPPDEEPRLP